MCLGYLASNFNLSKPSAALAPGCLAKNKQQPWLCMYVNETLPFVKTPLYLVNQLASIWDTFCNIDGAMVQNALQISCTPHGDFSIMEWHYCFQYVSGGRVKGGGQRGCTAQEIIGVVNPMQEQYINDTLKSGLMARPGNGGFYHSCHSGGYWVSAMADGSGEYSMPACHSWCLTVN